MKRWSYRLCILLLCVLIPYTNKAVFGKQHKKKKKKLNCFEGMLEAFI